MTEENSPFFLPCGLCSEKNSKSLTAESAEGAENSLGKTCKNFHFSYLILSPSFSACSASSAVNGF